MCNIYIRLIKPSASMKNFQLRSNYISKASDRFIKELWNIDFGLSIFIDHNWHIHHVELQHFSSLGWDLRRGRLRSRQRRLDESKQQADLKLQLEIVKRKTVLTYRFPCRLFTRNSVVERKRIRLKQKRKNSKLYWSQDNSSTLEK